MNGAGAAAAIGNGDFMMRFLPSVVYFLDNDLAIFSQMYNCLLMNYLLYFCMSRNCIFKLTLTICLEKYYHYDFFFDYSSSFFLFSSINHILTFLLQNQNYQTTQIQRCVTNVVWK